LFQFHLEIVHEIIYNAVTIKTPPPRCPIFARSVGSVPALRCPRSPVSLLTAISSHCLATLPAKMSAFNSHMLQYACYLNLKWTLEDLLPCYC